MLKLFTDDNKKTSLPEVRSLSTSPRSSMRSHYQARLERKWLHALAEDFSVQELIRQARLCQFIHEESPVLNLTVLDIGCGGGFFSRYLRDHGAHVTAIDGANNALNYFKKVDAKGITLQQDIFPDLKLPDQTFDLILALDLIAELERKDYRLAMSELSRLVKPEGKILIATALDPDTVDPLFYLQKLIETEFILEKTTCFHDFYSRKLSKWITLSKTTYLLLEKISHFLHGDERATYAMVSARRKKL